MRALLVIALVIALWGAAHAEPIAIVGAKIYVKPGQVIENGTLVIDRGKVTAVGAGRLLKNGKRAPIQLKVGDQILFGKYAGTEVTVNDVEFKILRENEVLARCD